MKPTVVLQDWALVVDPSSATPYTPPECLEYLLTGKVYGHPNHSDGKLVTTTRVLQMIDDETFETKNTIYKVGEKNEGYKKYLEEISNVG